MLKKDTKRNTGIVTRQGATETHVECVRDQMKTDSMQRFMTLCRRLNFDPRSPKTLLQVLFIGSRFHHDLSARAEIEGGLRELSRGDEVTVDWDHVARMAKEHYFCTIKDWHCMLLYLVLDNFEMPSAPSHALRRLEQALQQAGLDQILPTTTEVLVGALLHLYVLFTPQDKMLERFFIDRGRQNGHTPPHDLEMRCLRALAVFNDNVVDQVQAKHDFINSLSHMTVTDGYVHDVHRQRSLRQRSSRGSNFGTSIAAATAAAASVCATHAQHQSNDIV